MGRIYFLSLSNKYDNDHTAFFKFKDIMPECYFNREEYPRIEVATCIKDIGNCHVNHNCFEILFKRVKILFNETVVPGTSLIVLYFRKFVVPGLGAVVFDRQFDKIEPRWITMNPSGWNKLKSYSDIYSFQATSEFFLGRKDG